jgi:hypothetical protein
VIMHHKFVWKENGDLAGSSFSNAAGSLASGNNCLNTPDADDVELAGIPIAGENNALSEMRLQVGRVFDMNNVVSIIGHDDDVCTFIQTLPHAVGVGQRRAFHATDRVTDEADERIVFTFRRSGVPLCCGCGKKNRST